MLYRQVATFQCWSFCLIFVQHVWSRKLLGPFCQVGSGRRERFLINSDGSWELYQEASAGGLGPILKAHNNESDPMIRWWCHRRSRHRLVTSLAVWLIAAIAACKKGGFGADVSRKIVISWMIWLAIFLISIFLLSIACSSPPSNLWSHVENNTWLITQSI